MGSISAPWFAECGSVQTRSYTKPRLIDVGGPEAAAKIVLGMRKTPQHGLRHQSLVGTGKLNDCAPICRDSNKPCLTDQQNDRVRYEPSLNDSPIGLLNPVKELCTWTEGVRWSHTTVVKVRTIVQVPISARNHHKFVGTNPSKYFCKQNRGQ